MPPSRPRVPLRSLRTRREFLAAARAKRFAAPGLVVQQVRRPEGQDSDQDMTPVAGVGFTASKKVGNAVARNRAKRRMRALAGEILSVRAEPGYDYVLIARQALLDRPFDALRADLVRCLDRLQGARANPAREPAR